MKRKIIHGLLLSLTLSMVMTNTELKKKGRTSRYIFGFKRRSKLRERNK